MTDHLDLEPILEDMREMIKTADRGHIARALPLDVPIARALISEVERLQADVERKGEVVSRAMRLCEQERALMTLNVLREALSESLAETKGENG